jgi:hypothetical protein
MSSGTYVGLKPSAPTMQKLQAYIRGLGIPFKEEFLEKLHVTVMYSRVKLPSLQVNPSINYLAYPKKLEVFPTQTGARALVLKLDAPGIVTRHKELMRIPGATFDYPSFKVHVTLSYDIGKMDISKLPVYDVSVNGPLIFSDEYEEVLKLDWAE